MQQVKHQVAWQLATYQGTTEIICSESLDTDQVKALVRKKLKFSEFPIRMAYESIRITDTEYCD